MGERPPASAPRLPAQPRRDFAPRRPPQAEKFLCRRLSSRSPLGLFAPRLAVLRCWLSRCARACEALGADPELRGARGGDRGVQPGQGVGARRGVGVGVGTRLRSSGPTGGGGVRGDGCSQAPSGRGGAGTAALRRAGTCRPCGERRPRRAGAALGRCCWASVPSRLPLPRGPARLQPPPAGSPS